MSTEKKVIVRKATAKKVIAKKASPSVSKKVINVIGREEARDVFVDGMAEIMSGPTISKISFHTTINSNAKEETRKIALRLVMSTDAMLKMVENFQSAIHVNKEAIIRGATSHQQKILGLINKS